MPVTSNDEVGELTGRFNTMVEGLRERERIRETFGRYVDESVAATILRRQGEARWPARSARPPSCSPTSRASPPSPSTWRPHELVAALNEYLETVLEPIRAHGGVVNTFIGDGLFASFNMPLACDDHACAAVRAAIDIQRAVGEPHLRRPRRGAWPPGSASAPGHVIGGSVGAGRRLSYTLLGDTVNLAARLEQLNKDHGTRILVSQSTRDACGEHFVFAGARHRGGARAQRCGRRLQRRPQPPGKSS